MNHSTRLALIFSILILTYLGSSSAIRNVFERPREFVTMIFDHVADIVTSADDTALEAAASSLQYLDRSCECTGAPPYQVCGCCVTIAEDDAFAEPFCVQVEFSGTSLVSRLIEDGNDVATWEDLVGELVEGISICVDILPRPSPRVSKQGCSQSGLGSLSVCLVPQVVEPSFDGGVGYYEICITLDLGFIDIFGYSVNLGCFSFGASSEDWDCVYPSSTNPNELPVCHDICPDNSDNWIEQWSSESNPDDDLVFSKQCGAVKTDEGLCVKGCFAELEETAAVAGQINSDQMNVGQPVLIGTILTLTFCLIF